jgi:hypothetical protein
MDLQYRSKVDYAQIYAGDRQGFNLGLDGSIFVRKESTPRVFNAPRIGTQGTSTGDASASTDISGGTDNALKVAVDDGAAVDVVLDLTGLNTGDAIAAELELKINQALAAANLDTRVWVFYDNSDDHYVVYSQSTGTTSAVVITDATADNVADDLKLGTVNGGTEVAGTDDQDFLLYTTGGPVYGQPIESNAHRTGRFHTSPIKKKKEASFDIDTMVNMSGNAGDSLDTAVKLMLESVFGTETVVSGQSITYTQGLPNFYFSMVRVSTVFGEYYTGGYCKDYTLTVPCDAPGTQKYTGMLSKAAIAGIGQLDGDVVSSADVVLNSGEADRYTADACVMVLDTDGRTILAGADGSLKVNSVNTTTHTVTLNSTLSANDDGYLVPWNPGAMQQTGRDNIYTDLEGTFKFDAAGDSYCATNISLNVVNDHVDINNCFGNDSNQGFVAGNRCTMTLSVTLDLSTKAMAQLVQAREFDGLSPELVIGNAASGRYLRITAPKSIVSVPNVEVPESGTTPVTFEGILYQSSAGARDPVSVEWR